MSGVGLRGLGNIGNEAFTRLDEALKDVKPNKPQSSEVSEVKGGNFEGAKIKLEKGDVSKGVDEMRQSSRERLGEGRGFGAKIANILAAIVTVPVVLAVKTVATIVGTVTGLALGGLGKLVNKAIGSTETQDHQAGWRDRLGSKPMEGSILNKEVKVGGETKSLPDALEQHRQTLGGDARLSKDDMLKYVAMGERIMHSLANAPSDPPPKQLELTDVNGQKVGLRANLEATRAISWYLQAKAVVDNSGHGDGALLKEGAMVAKDPGNKLFNFLSSSNNAYGRISSHMKERSDSHMGGLSIVTSAWKGGFAAMFGVGLQGKPLQHGIEDFDNRMPSKGGSLLFDKLKPSKEGGDPEVFLKWEGVGVPNSFSLSGGDHAQDSAADKLWNRGIALFRSLEHSFHFASDKNPVGYRGEKMEKGEAKKFLDDFKTLVNRLSGVDEETKKSMIKHVGKGGATEMNRALDVLRNAKEVTAGEKKIFDFMQQKLGEWMDRMGADLGIARKGQEVHVSLT